MRITEAQLRDIIKSEVKRFNKHLNEETAADEKKAGTAGAKGTEGTLDVKKIADTLGLDSDKLKLAVADLKRNKRSAIHDKMFGDVFAKLMGASESDTVKVMNVLKKVEAAE